jgi:AcrR family transcriptional regulator
VATKPKTETGAGTASEGSERAEPSRRPYNGARRREQAGQTRDRIVSAGSELLHRSSIRDWRGLTVRAVAERAGVNERTVYRYFGNERGLRDAVMQREEQDAGIDLAGMQLDDIADIASRTEWPAEDLTVAAAMFDVLWSVATYDRLVVDWQVDQKRAIRGIAWVIGLVEEAVRTGEGP